VGLLEPGALPDAVHVPSPAVVAVHVHSFRPPTGRRSEELPGTCQPTKAARRPPRWVPRDLGGPWGGPARASVRLRARDRRPLGRGPEAVPPQSGAAAGGRASRGSVDGGLVLSSQLDL